MRTKTKYRSWMAEEIAKTYLLESGELDITNHLKVDSSRFDLVVMPKNDVSKIILIEIKASIQSKSEILEVSRKTNKELSKQIYPVIIFYINYVDKTGYIELINNGLSTNLVLLTTDNLKILLKKIISPGADTHGTNDRQIIDNTVSVI